MAGQTLKQVVNNQYTPVSNVIIDADNELILDGLLASRVGSKTLQVFTASDLDNSEFTIAGVITIATGDSLTVEFKNGAIISPVEFVLEGTASLRLIGITADAALIYSGTGIHISGDMFVVFIDNLQLISTSTGAFINLTSGVFAIRDTFLGGFDNLGSHIGSAFVIRGTTASDCLSGFTVTGAGMNMGANQLLLPDLVGNFVNYVAGPSDVTITIIGVVGELAPASALFRIDPGISAGTLLSFDHNAIRSGELFDITGGSTGTFTVVDPANIAATAITGVTFPSGVARFAFTGPTVFVDQEVVNSTFVTNTNFNGTFIITATDGTSYFEVSSITTGTDEAGSFLSFSVTLTDTATTLVNGDTLVIDTDGSALYDGGAKIYNKTTNTVQINRTHTTTATGSWDTSGIDPQNPRLLAARNPGFKDSKTIASAFVNDNSIVNGAIVNNTFRDITFGTAGSALIAGSTIERWKLLDDVIGVFECISIEPVNGLIHYDFTVDSSGGTVEFEFKWLIDKGSGFVDLDDPVKALVAVGNDAQSVTKSFALRAVLGDKIKPQITRKTGASTIITRNATIFAPG